ncbi:MAG: hypothetical protein U9N83_08745 [Thermodesulfobacteriota bacterium]|nr:hypothetical protein [Thermodesulfobacteriota bacterium]
MKITISSSGTNLDEQVDPEFRSASLVKSAVPERFKMVCAKFRNKYGWK